MGFTLTTSSSTEKVGTAYLEVKLSQASAQVVSVDYKATGGTASSANYGTGADYQLAAGTLTFQPGTTVNKIPLLVYDDGVSQLDQTVVVTLSNPVNATLSSSSAETYTITDDDRKVMVSVKDATFGAKGDGVTDDTAAIQKAVSYVFSNGGGVLLFPAGTYMVKEVYIGENITYQGLPGAVIKLPAMQPNGTHTFDCYPKYAGNTDSPPLVIDGLTFDGNSQNQGAYQNWELEQSMLLMLQANPAYPGKLKAVVQNCTFQNAVSDGISVYVNVDLSVYNCVAQDVFRGGLVIVGGNSKVYAKNLTVKGDRDPGGIDFEVCNEGVGYGNTKRIDVVLEDVNCLTGDFDAGFVDGSGSTLQATRCSSGKPPAGKYATFSFYGGGNGTYNFTDCTFYVGFKYNSTNNCFSPGKSTYTNCNFIATNAATTRSSISSFPYVTWNYNSSWGNQVVTFNNCTFSADSTVAGYTRYAYQADALSNGNQVVLNGCTYTSLSAVHP